MGTPYQEMKRLIRDARCARRRERKRRRRLNIFPQTVKEMITHGFDFYPSVGSNRSGITSAPTTEIAGAS